MRKITFTLLLSVAITLFYGCGSSDDSSAQTPSSDTAMSADSSADAAHDLNIDAPDESDTTPAPVLVAPFELTWQPAGESAPRQIQGFAPVASGSYPVFVFTQGTFTPFWNAGAPTIVKAMAERGFVAVSVDYDNDVYTFTCDQLDAKAVDIYDTSRVESALAMVCARDDADCTRVVTSGYSQGGQLAVRARNVHPDVKAAFVIATGISIGVPINLAECVAMDNTVLMPGRVRSIIGANDDLFGGSPDGTQADVPGVRRQQEMVTGASCGDDAFDCIGDDGSGFYLVQAAELVGGEDDHVFHLNEGVLDSNFVTGTEPWNMTPSLTWLAEQAQR